MTRELKPLRPTGDVAALPTVVFGPRSLMWWGTLGFMTIEGFSVLLLVVVYFYLRQNFITWPPEHTPYPSVLIPTINALIMLASCVPAYLAAERAKKLDYAGSLVWLIVSSVLGIPILVLRWYELWALNTRWDSNAYGSAAWVLVGFHTTLLLMDVADTWGLTLFYVFRRTPVRIYSDTADNSFYWYFTVGIWIPLYLIVYLGPRVF